MACHGRRFSKKGPRRTLAKTKTTEVDFSVDYVTRTAVTGARFLVTGSD